MWLKFKMISKNGWRTIQGLQLERIFSESDIDAIFGFSLNKSPNNEFLLPFREFYTFPNLDSSQCPGELT